MNSRIEWVVVADGYHCPLCPDHTDERFGRVQPIPQPLCDGCLIELDHYALAPYWALRPDWQRNAVLLEELTGRTWPELRGEIIQAQLDYWTVLQGDENDLWHAVMSKQGWSQERRDEFIDQQLSKLCAARDEAALEC